MYQSAKELANKGARKVGNLIEHSTGKVVGAVVAGGPSVALAAGPDYTALTGAVDWTTVVAAVLAIAAGVAVLYMTQKGAKLIIDAIKRA